MLPGLAGIAGFGGSVSGSGTLGDAPTAGTEVFGNNVSSLDVPFPSGIVANDILICHVAFADGVVGVNASAPAGWNYFYSLGRIIGSYPSQWIFWKRATGSESGTQTFTFSSGTGVNVPSGAVMTRWPGAITSGTPLEMGAGKAYTGSTSMSAPALTTLQNNRLAINFHANGDAGASSPGSGWTEAYDVGTILGNDLGMSCSYKLISTAGTTGGETRTIVSTPWNSIAVTMMPPGATYAGSAIPSKTLWGCNITDTDAAYFGGGNYYCNIAEQRYYDSAGGLITLGTASDSAHFSGATNDASKAHDSNGATCWSGDVNGLHALPGATPVYLANTFGSAQSPVSFVMMGFDGSLPRGFSYGYSDDSGATWNAMVSASSQPSSVANELRGYRIPSSS